MKDVKILVVEDEESIREAIIDYLNLKGYKNVLAASTGKEAIKKIEEDKPDIAFLDIQLADDIDGIQVLKKCREVSPQTKAVMLSAYQDEYGKQAKELGAYGFLKKPIQIGALDKFVQEAVKE